ncbi:hypothetical protein DFS34DRAFT_634056 [Phlyctochytrium arcticum]|nr:hypothetical protein DFS34DRAFT_634056 [Phlyctochytrium arcticum]
MAMHLVTPCALHTTYLILNCLAENDMPIPSVAGPSLCDSFDGFQRSLCVPNSVEGTEVYIKLSGNFEPFLVEVTTSLTKNPVGYVSHPLTTGIVCVRFSFTVECKR